MYVQATTTTIDETLLSKEEIALRPNSLPRSKARPSEWKRKVPVVCATSAIEGRAAINTERR